MRNSIFAGDWYTKYLKHDSGKEEPHPKQTHIGRGKPTNKTIRSYDCIYNQDVFSSSSEGKDRRAPQKNDHGNGGAICVDPSCPAALCRGTNEASKIEMVRILDHV